MNKRILKKISMRKLSAFFKTGHDTMTKKENRFLRMYAMNAIMSCRKSKEEK